MLPLIAYGFTERVQRVLAKARDEAVRLNHEYIGTEHILLALIRQGEGVAASVLHNINVPPQQIRQEVLAIVRMGHLTSMPLRDLPYTTRGKKVLDLAITEAMKLKHDYCGTEHVLLGLILENEGIAAQALAACGITYAVASGELLRLGDASDPSSKEGATETG